MRRDEAKGWLRALRTQAGLTQADVADRLEVSTRTVQNMENPKYGFPNGFTMLRYLDVIGALQTPKPSRVPASDEVFLARAEEVLLEVRRRLRPPLEDPPNDALAGEGAR